GRIDPPTGVGGVGEYPRVLPFVFADLLYDPLVYGQGSSVLPVIVVRICLVVQVKTCIQRIIRQPDGGIIKSNGSFGILQLVGGNSQIIEVGAEIIVMCRVAFIKVPERLQRCLLPSEVIATVGQNNGHVYQAFSDAQTIGVLQKRFFRLAEITECTVCLPFFPICQSSFIIWVAGRSFLGALPFPAGKER